jgi:hypothetical protein
MSTQNNEVNDTTIAESFFQKNILPNDSIISSLRDANKQTDWKGRVIANIEITRNPIRLIIAEKDNFFEFRRYVVSELSNKLGSGFYISVNTIQMEETLRMRYFLKVRVSKAVKQDLPKTTKSTASPNTTAVVQVAVTVKCAPKKGPPKKIPFSFAVLATDDD